MAPRITVEHLEIGWDSRTLLKDVSFTVPRGSCFAILGGSGCGKSSLLRHLIGLEIPRAGRIDIAGVGDPAAWTGQPAFGVMFQSGALYGSLDLLDNCLLPLRAWTRLDESAARTQAQAKLNLVGLGAAAHRLPGEISGGMRKRAGIARAMVLEPDLLFLDEPSAGLDPITAVELDDLIRLLTRTLGMTVVLVTHELPSIFAVVEQCIVLDAATRNIIAQGDPRELRDHSPLPFVHAFFNRTPMATP